MDTLCQGTVAPSEISRFIANISLATRLKSSSLSCLACHIVSIKLMLMRSNNDVKHATFHTANNH
jgi:hypothetical protein